MRHREKNRRADRHIVRSIALAGRTLAATVAISSLGIAPASAATRYQIAVDQAVFLTARDPLRVPFDADFALTSPAGITRHARVASNGRGEAIVRFGGPATDGDFGLPEVDFDPGLAGDWHWRCVVRTRVVARGSFTVRSDGRTGRQTIETTPAEF